MSKHSIYFACLSDRSYIFQDIIYKTAYAHEQYVTSRIYKLVDLAISEKDYATQSMLKWYVDEQMEEEDNTGGIVSKLEFLGGYKHSVYIVDRELAAR
mgnify:CR=1 FL=1